MTICLFKVHGSKIFMYLKAKLTEKYFLAWVCNGEWSFYQEILLKEKIFLQIKGIR